MKRPSAEEFEHNLSENFRGEKVVKNYQGKLSFMKQKAAEDDIVYLQICKIMRFARAALASLACTLFTSSLPFQALPHIFRAGLLQMFGEIYRLEYYNEQTDKVEEFHVSYFVWADFKEWEFYQNYVKPWINWGIN